jgi:hypothetical protein
MERKRDMTEVVLLSIVLSLGLRLLMMLWMGGYFRHFDPFFHRLVVIFSATSCRAL